MANGNFIVQNGLTVGPLTIDAATGDISTSGNVSITGNLGVSQISKNDSSVTISDSGSGSSVIIAIDGATETTIDAAGLKLPSGDAYYINGTSVLNATTLGSGVTASSLTSVGTLTGLTLSGTLTGTTVNAATIGNAGAALTGATLTLTSTLNAAGTATVNALTSNGAISGTTGTFTGAVAGTSTANFAGAVTVASLSANADVTVGGNLTVNGTTTTVNSTTLTVDDKNIELGSVASPSNTTADGGGITLKGATDKTFNWVNATAAWTSSEDLNLLTGKVYEINGTTVLSASTLGSGVTASSLTSVGTLTGLTSSGVITSTVATGTAPFTVASTTAVTNLNADLWDGNHFASYLNQAVLSSSSPTFAGLTLPSITHNGTTGVGDIGQSGSTFATVYATTFSGVSTTAKYADLAEKYSADAEYEPGTVLMFGGDAEVTLCVLANNRRVAGVVTTAPAHLMNSELTGTTAAIALQGRVPCKVQGPVRKGDMIVSAGDGKAKAEENPEVGAVIGKALENFDGEEGVIEVVVGRI